ncbi:MAG: hypothetical protein AVDCRST_MAG32-1808 [uncultured Nocardioides sp.]|uniref:Uncharacterized protein n=1 Tax=uncultured Nocardioides sp. TaxID=198441 RepID=A0A6J4NEX6_9ACTN|nr:MAG: hypothetical protein AVDCRST_MAG32-1808 [uncultured Nocardioides sp.]
MRNTQSWERTAAGTPARVRDQAREVLAVVTFSAVTASCLAVALLLLANLGRQG